MPFPSGTYILQIGDGATRAELEQFYSLLAGYLSKEHKDDGSHSAVTADAVDVSGNLSVDGTITADADGSPVIIGETVSGPGIDINRTVSGVLTNWRIFADVSSGSPMLAIKDVGQVADASLLDIIRTVAGAAPEYTFRPHSSAHQLKLGADSAGQRWAEVSASVYSGGERGTWTPTLQFGGGSTGITYSTRSGTYTKVCNLVTVEMQIVLTSKGSSTGTAQISGLPYSSAASPAAVLDVAAGGASLGSTPYATVFGTSLFPVHLVAGVRTQMTDTNFSGTDDLRIGLTYRV